MKLWCVLCPLDPESLRDHGVIHEVEGHYSLIIIGCITLENRIVKTRISVIENNFVIVLQLSCQQLYPQAG